ncbi:winged helix-turn-helix domain-containing tetratricopeptide repeat protein [Ostreiculturibacter nitratireducens]|uniref:winged helix-turn-helix domain-containing tetratricopeptide repeat protein n=1 Tax=Ostreiculturibacter nitratireducens TaxID=3075226 RepID=UPI0031B60EB0
MKGSQAISFLDFRLDPARGELTRAGVPVPVEPQVLDLIIQLATHAGNIVTRDELIAHVWGGRIVSESAIASRINAARAALGDDGASQRIIKTIPRRGFRFDAEISVTEPDGPTLPDKPSVAVLPFQNLSGDPEQTYFSDGITEDIITDLSRYDDLFVIARHSSFAFRDASLSPSEIARELGVQYLVEGSVRRAGARIRVTARLVDPIGGNDLWSERYDRDMRDIFEVQDEISSVIVNTLVGAITRQHHRLSLQKSDDAVNAYDHFLRAVELNYRMEPAKARAARAEAKKALECDGGLARAHALVAWTHISEASNAWAEDTRKALDLAKAAGLAGVSANNREPFAHAVLGWVYMWSDKAFERGIEEQRRAIEANPGNAQFRSMFAFSLTYAGRSAEALSALDEAMRLNPYYPELFHVFYGRALFNLHRYEEAMPRLERIRSSQPCHANALAHAAACYAALGRLEEARETVAEVNRASVRYTLSHAREFVAYADPEEKAHYLENLALAGLAG